MNEEFADVLRSHLAFSGARPLTPESNLRDLGLDSMRAIDLLFALEDRYEVMFPDELMTESTFETYGSLWNALASLRTDGAS